MKRLLLAIALVMTAPALADSSMAPAPWANRQLPDPRQEARAQALMETLRCVVCQGQSIADSDAELAGDMRSMVRERIAHGESPDQIATALAVSPYTLRTHVQNVLTKLGVHSKLEALAFAIRQGKVTAKQ